MDRESGHISPFHSFIPLILFLSEFTGEMQVSAQGWLLHVGIGVSEFMYMRLHGKLKKE